MILYIVGKSTADGWEFQGIFSDENKAIGACKTNEYWIGPVTLDQEIPDETTDWPGQYYPTEGKRK